MRVAPSTTTHCPVVWLLRREQEDHAAGDFVGGGHALAEGMRCSILDRSAARSGEAGEPLGVERGHHLGRDDGVDADAVVAQGGGPFARQGEEGALAAV